MPTFSYDFFISYAHIDNQPFDASRGWIDLLHERLEIRLAQLLGEKPKIWRDPKLQGNDYFGDTLLIRLAEVRLLVSVLSPRYLNSEWCLRELRAFQQHAAQNLGVRIDDKSRIFKVLKTPVGLEKQPPELQGLLGYEFYQTDPATGRPREFSHHTSEAARDERYWQKLNDLAWDIKELLERLKGAAAVTPPRRKTVYLAETTSDLSEQRDSIKRELLQHGHRVLPDRPLSLNPQLRSEVRNCLTESQLAIHLIGAGYGVVPEGESLSIIELQHDLAVRQSQHSTLFRIVWLPVGLTTADSRQQQFIDELLNHSDATRKSELLQTKLEDLKTFVQEKLEAEERLSAAADDEDDSVRISLICDEQDFDSVKPIYNYLLEDFRVSVPTSSRSQSAKSLRENVRRSDAVLLYYGQASADWFDNMLRLIRRYIASEKNIPLSIFAGAPRTPQKELLMDTGSFEVILNFDAFTPDSLAAFLNKVRSAKGASL